MVCGRHREHTLCSPANFLGDGRQGRRDIRNFPNGPSPKGEVLLPGVCGAFGCVPSPHITHLFDLGRGAGLAVGIYWRCGEIDARQDVLPGDEPHHPSVPEKAPPSLHLGVVICHGVKALLVSCAAASYATASVARVSSNSSPTAPPSRVGIQGQCHHCCGRYCGCGQGLQCGP